MTGDRPATQTERLLALLRAQGSRGVTPLDALNSIGSFRLAARISDLKEAGHAIESGRVKTASGAVVACYVLRDPEPVEQGSLGL